MWWSVLCRQCKLNQVPRQKLGIQYEIWCLSRVISQSCLKCECYGTLTWTFRLGFLWKLLYADYLVIIYKSLNGSVSKLAMGKDNLQAKSIKVNTGKQRSNIAHQKKEVMLMLMAEINHVTFVRVVMM